MRSGNKKIRPLIRRAAAPRRPDNEISEITGNKTTERDRRVGARPLDDKSEAVQVAFRPPFGRLFRDKLQGHGRRFVLLRTRLSRMLGFFKGRRVLENPTSGYEIATRLLRSHVIMFRRVKILNRRLIKINNK